MSKEFILLAPMARVKRSFLWVLLLIAVFFVLISIASPPGRMLRWDEVNYITASAQGPIANAFDKNSLNPIHFISLAWSKINSIPPPSEPYNYISNLDTLYLRHTHPPLLQYITSYFALLDISQVNSISKIAYLTRFSLGSFLIISSYYMSTQLEFIPKTIVGKILFYAIILYSTFLLSIDIQYHVLIAISMFWTVLGLRNLLRSNTSKDLIIFSLIISFSILSLETSIILILSSIVIYLVYNSERLRSNSIILVKEICIYFLITPSIISFLLWPGSVFKLSVFKPYAYHLFRVFKVKEEYSEVFTFESLSNILPIIVGLLLCSLLSSLLLTRVSRNHNLISYHISIFIGITYSIVMIPFLDNITFITPGLFVSSIPLPSLIERNSCFNRLFSRLTSAICIILLAFNMAYSINPVRASISLPDFPGWKSLDELEKIFIQNEDLNIYVDGGHILRFYLPDYKDRIFSIEKISSSSKYKKMNFEIYTKIDNRFKMLDLEEPKIIIIQNSVMKQKDKNFLVELGQYCKPIDLPNLTGGKVCIVR